MAHFFSRKFRTTFILTLLLSLRIHCLKLWPNPGSLPGLIPAPCRATLTKDIACSDLISPGEITNDVPFVPKYLETYCNASCKSSLQVRTDPSVCFHNLIGHSHGQPASIHDEGVLSTHSAIPQSSPEMTLRSH